MDMAISEPLGQMDDIQAWPNRFTIIALILDFAAFLRASHCGVTFLRVHIFILNSFFPVSLMLSDSRYFTLEYHCTAGRVRFSCDIVCDDAFYSYYSVFATIVLF